MSQRPNCSVCGKEVAEGDGLASEVSTSGAFGKPQVTKVMHGECTIRVRRFKDGKEIDTDVTANRR